MVEHAITAFGSDHRKVFVTGLSAGGAMASVMLATYPEVFAGGAIIARLPYGCANNVQQAFEAMFTERGHAPRSLGDRVRVSVQTSRAVAENFGLARHVRSNRKAF
jgi:poly(3-hydroxybutyrate) depolymerase